MIFLINGNMFVAKLMKNCVKQSLKYWIHFVGNMQLLTNCIHNTCTQQIKNALSNVARK
jgi:hypothetical protein